MLQVICSNCQLFQHALFIKVLRWNLPWLESLFLRLLMMLFLCWGWEPGFHLSALICDGLPEAASSLLALPCKDMHQPHLLCLWSTLCLGAAGELPFSSFWPLLPFPSEHHPKLRLEYSSQPMGFALRRLFCVELYSAHAQITQRTLQTRPLCDAALPLAIFNECLQSLGVLSAGLLPQSLDLKVVAFQAWNLDEVGGFEKPRAFLCLMAWGTWVEAKRDSFK